MYTWNPAHLGELLALPAGALTRPLHLYSGEQLRVLLWLARHSPARFDAAACAADTGLSPAACAGVLRFWQDAGVLCGEASGGGDAASVGAAVTALQPPSQEAIPTTIVPQPRPAAVKPTMPEVLTRRKEDPTFAYLLQTAEARLGRPLTHGDQETLLYLYGTAGLPAAVVILAIMEAVADGKGHMRYIEKMALDWADRGIDTVDGAEAHLAARRRQREAWERVQVLLELSVQHPVKAQRDAAVLWLEEWQLPGALIRLAYDRCVARTGKFQASYISKVLDAWRLEGYRSPEDVAAAEAAAAAARSSGGKGRGKQPREKSAPGSMDLDEYEELVSRYRPQYQANSDAKEPKK